MFKFRCIFVVFQAIVTFGSLGALRVPFLLGGGVEGLTVLAPKRAAFLGRSLVPHASGVILGRQTMCSTARPCEGLDL